MSDAQIPTLRRRKSAEEQVAFIREQAVEETPEAGSDLEEEFLSLVRKSRGGFSFVWLYLVVGVIGFMISVVSAEPAIRLAGTLIAAGCSIIAPLHFLRAVILELRGSYEAGVIVLLKAIEGRPADVSKASLAQQANQLVQSWALESERQQRLARASRVAQGRD